MEDTDVDTSKPHRVRCTLPHGLFEFSAFDEADAQKGMANLEAILDEDRKGSAVWTRHPEGTRGS